MMRVITDIEGLKDAIQRAEAAHLSIKQVFFAIDAHTIDAPDLVKREDMIDAAQEGNPVRAMNNVPEWDGKE